MKLGTIVQMPDGRVGTVVYNSLIGVGIKWGQHFPDINDFEETSGNTVHEEVRPNWPWTPDALLRDPSRKFPGLFEKYGFKDSDLVGSEFEIIE